MKTYYIAVSKTPNLSSLDVDISESKLNRNERHWLEFHLVSLIKHGKDIVVSYWLTTDIEGLVLTKALLNIFKTNKISILELN